MSSPFTAKRVQVPGLLSDEGLAARIKDLQSTAKTTQQTAPPPNSAFDKARDIMSLPGSMPQFRTPQANPFPGLKLPEQPAPKPQAGFGMLTPEESAAEQQARIQGAKEYEQTQQEGMALVEKLEAYGEGAYRTASPQERMAAGLPPNMALGFDKLRELAEQNLAGAQEQTSERTTAPAPQQTWWMNMLQVGARTAAQSGTSALKYPFVAFESTVDMATGIKTGKLPPRQWLDAVDESLNKMLPGDPARAKDFMTELAAGGGSMASFLLAGYIGRVVGLPAGVTSGGLGAAVEGTQMYEEAESFDATSWQKFVALVLGSGLGATEAIPIDNAFFRADVATGGLVRQLLRNTAATSLEEFAQEVGQAAGEDLIAKYLSGYDPTREVDPLQWLRAGAVGAITGGVAGGLTTLVPGATAPVELSAVDEAQLTTAVEEALNAEQARFDAIVPPEDSAVSTDAAADGTATADPAGPAADPTAAVGAQNAAGPEAPRAPVGDAVQQIVAQAKPAQQTAVSAAAAQAQDVVLDPQAPPEQQLAVKPAPAIETPEFKTWFGESKVVTPEGAPLRVYHGTTVLFDSLEDIRGNGIWFTSDPALADLHAARDTRPDGRSGGSPRVIPAFVALKNPLVVERIAAPLPVRRAGAKVQVRRGDVLSIPDSLDAVRQARAGGYDGVIFKGLRDQAANVPQSDIVVAFEPTQIKSALANDGSFDADDPNINSQIARPAVNRAVIEATPIAPAELAPLPNIEKGLTGPIPMVVKAAKAYAAAVGMPHRRAREYVKVDVQRAARIAQAYADMPHQPQDPAVLAAYTAMAEETIAQYQFVLATGLKVEAMQDGQPDPYPNGPRDVLKDIASGHIWYFPTKFGFGSDATFDPKDNPLLETTEFVSDNGEPMLVNDLFRVVHDFFGHGLEGSGFGARGEENAWQSHMRLYSESAVPAMTSETRGQNSWVNYGPYGEQNRANPRETVYADQKTGIMPSWTWQEGVVDSAAQPMPVTDAQAFVAAISAAKAASPFGAVVNVYKPSKYARMKLFLTPDNLSGFALDGEDIVSVFSHNDAPRGRLRTLIDTALANGGRTLDAFDTGLPQMYARLGFREVRREPWNEKYKPKDWPAELGKPDVVYMEYGIPDIEAQSAVPLRRRTETLEPFGLTERRNNTRQIAAALELRQQAQAGKIDKNDRSPETRDKIARWMTEEVLFELETPGASGAGWYSEKFQRALDIFASTYPELADSKDARNMLTLFIAITSDGQKVVPNFAQAIDIYGNYRSGNGLKTSRGHIRQSSIDTNLARIQTLLDEGLSPAELHAYFMSEDTVSNLKKEAAAKGLEFATKYQANIKLPRAAVELGPKLGAFYSNLMGSTGYLTMDRWWSRTFNRYRGDLLTTASAPGLVRFKGLIGRPDISDEEALTLVVPYRQSYEAKNFKDGTEIEKAANTLYKDAFENLNDTPFSATDRTFMVETVGRAREILAEQGIEITVADIQAVLWYYEKRLYGELGARQSEDISYEEAAARVVATHTRGRDGSGVGDLFEAAADGSGNQGAIGEAALVDRMAGTSTARNPYRAEPVRPASGIATQPGTEPNDAKLTNISKNFIRLLNLTARQGRLVTGKDTMGEYNRRSATVRLRIWSDLSTLVHEGGHAINDSMGQPLIDFVQRNDSALRKIAQTYYAADLSKAPAQTRQREGFAEFFRVYTLTPDFARKKFPQLVTDFENVLSQHDAKLKDGLAAIASQFKAWLQLPSAQLIRNQIVDGRREKGISAAVKELKDLGFKTWMQEYARRGVEWSTNRYAPLNQLVNELLQTGDSNLGQALDLKRADDPRALIRLSRNAGSRGMVEVTDGVYGYKSTQPISRGLREALMVSQGVDPDSTPGSIDEERLKDFDTYLVARRAFDEYRRFDEGLIDRPPINASKGDVVKAIKEYEKQYGDAFTRGAEIVHEYGMALWRKQFDAGLISKETYDDGLERQFYVPLQRDMSDKKGDFGPSALTSKGQGLQSLVQRFRGSDRDIVSPMSVLMHKTFALEMLINENDTKKALAVLADRVGAAGAMVERIPASQVIGMTMSVEDAARQLVKDDTLSATDAADLMTILGASIKDGNSISLFRREQVSTKGENILFFWENGKPAAIQLKDGDLGADVVNVMQSIGRENMDFWVEAIAASSTVFRTAITSWPDFLIVNYIRDQMSAWILSDVGFVPFVSGIRGMVDEVRQKTWAKQYNAAQGIMGGMNVAALHEARVDRDISALRSKGYIPQVFADKTPLVGAVRGFARLTALSETGTRLGLFRGAFNRAKSDGLNDYEASVEAAYIATDYIDFGLNGSRMLLARRTIPFLNAQLQGFYKMVRTLGATEVVQRRGLKFALGAYFKSTKNMNLSRTEVQAINTGRKAWGKMMSLGLLSALMHFLFEDDEDYQDAGEYLRVTHWVIPLGDGRIFTIPKPFELAMIANAVERGLEGAAGDSTAKDRFLRGVAFNLTPPTSPPAIQTAVELAANYDFFTGRPIVPSYMQALDPQLQYDNYSTSLARWMGRTFNMSPMVVDHVLSGLGASAYRDISSMINAADPNRPSMDATDTPILRRFVRDARRGSVSAQDFWAQASQTTGRLERASQSYKRFIDIGNEPAANQFLRTLNADERAYAQLMQRDVTEKKLNPFYRARQMTQIIGAMRREVASDQSLGDTMLKDSNETIPMTASQKGQVDEILSELQRREVRNTLIATEQPGWAGKKILPTQPTLDMLLTVNPDVYDEYVRRIAKKKIYDAQTVFDNWPEIRDRINADGEFAILTDVLALAEASAGMVF